MMLSMIVAARRKRRGRYKKPTVQQQKPAIEKPVVIDAGFCLYQVVYVDEIGVQYSDGVEAVNPATAVGFVIRAACERRTSGKYSVFARLVSVKPYNKF